MFGLSFTTESENGSIRILALSYNYNIFSEHMKQLNSTLEEIQEQYSIKI